MFELHATYVAYITDMIIQVIEDDERFFFAKSLYGSYKGVPYGEQQSPRARICTNSPTIPHWPAYGLFIYIITFNNSF